LESQKRRDANELAKAKDVVEGDVDGALKSADALIGEEADLARSLDTRLGALLGLMSVVLALSAPIAVSTAGAPVCASRLDRALATIALICQAIAALQLLRTLWCAIRGLSLRGVISLTLHDEIADPGESPLDHKKRRLCERVSVLQSRRKFNSDKGTSLKLAHRAALNALLFLLLWWAMLVVRRML
jgi:hypothetical protein